MQLSRRTRMVSVAAAVMVAAVTLSGASAVHARSASLANRDLARIHAHFDSVLAELGQRDLSGLSAAQRTRRAALIDSLRAYRDRGVFPHNYDFPRHATPYFVDRKTGALCAVANLLAITGRRDIVGRVAAANDNAWVAQLAGDTAFTSWLGANGFTLAEAARIQVLYVQQESTGDEARSVALAFLAPLSGAAALMTSVDNLSDNADGHRRVESTIGVLSGLATVGFGADLLAKPHSDKFQRLGMPGIALGGLSVALAARSMRRRSGYLAAQADSTRARPGAAARRDQGPCHFMNERT